MISEAFIINQTCLNKTPELGILPEITTSSVLEIQDKLNSKFAFQNELVELACVCLRVSKSVVLHSNNDIRIFSSELPNILEESLAYRKKLYADCFESNLSNLSRSLFTTDKQAKKPYIFSGSIYLPKKFATFEEEADALGTAFRLALKIHPLTEYLDGVIGSCKSGNLLDFNNQMFEMVKCIDFPFTSISNLLISLGYNYYDCDAFIRDEIYAVKLNHQEVLIVNNQADIPYSCNVDTFSFLYNRNLLQDITIKTCTELGLEPITQ
jgi:hypothetical protein